MGKIEDKRRVDLFQNRLQNLQKMLDCSNSDGAVLTYSRDILYFTGTAQPSYLVITPDEYHLFVKSGIEFVLNEIFIDPSKVEEERKLSNVYNRFFSNPSNKKIGIQFDVLTAKEYFLFNKTFGEIEFFDVSPLTLELRSIKDEYEIEQIKKACI